VGLSSSQHIARFWGLATGRPPVAEKAAERASAHRLPSAVPAHETPLLAARGSASTSAAFADPGAEESGVVGSHDQKVIITAALKAAGLLSDPGPTGYSPGVFDPLGVITATLRSVRLLKE